MWPTLLQTRAFRPQITMSRSSKEVSPSPKAAGENVYEFAAFSLMSCFKCSFEHDLSLRAGESTESLSVYEEVGKSSNKSCSVSHFFGWLVVDSEDFAAFIFWD